MRVPARPDSVRRVLRRRRNSRSKAGASVSGAAPQCRPKTAVRESKLAAVKSFCRWLEAEGLSETGSIDFIASRYRRDELPDVPSESEVTRLLDGGLAPRDRLILELLYGCGIRNSELVGDGRALSETLIPLIVEDANSFGRS
jgi:site-specific recombinase XerD